MNTETSKKSVPYVEVAQAEDNLLAKDYIAFLRENGIEAKIRHRGKADAPFSAYILVALDDYERAYDMIGTRQTYEQSAETLFRPVLDKDEEPEPADDYFLYLDPNRAA